MGHWGDLKDDDEGMAPRAETRAEQMTPYKSGPLSPEQLYELELTSRTGVEFVQIRPAVIAELVRSYNVCGFILANCRCEFPKGHEGDHSFEARLAMLHRSKVRL